MPNVPTLNILAQHIQALALKLGVKHIVIAAQDPVTNDLAFYGTDAAKTVVRPKIEEAFNLGEFAGGETAWNDV